MFWEEVGEELHKDISGYFKGCYYIEEALEKVIREAKNLKIKKEKCKNKKCPAWRRCGCFQNLEKICKKAKFENDKKKISSNKTKKEINKR